MGTSLGRGPEECEWSTFRKSQGTGDGMVYVREEEMWLEKGGGARSYPDASGSNV